MICYPLTSKPVAVSCVRGTRTECIRKSFSGPSPRYDLRRVRMAVYGRSTLDLTEVLTRNYMTKAEDW